MNQANHDKGLIKNVNVQYPHSVNHNDRQQEEVVAVQYKDIVCQHHIAGTSGYCVWE